MKIQCTRKNLAELSVKSHFTDKTIHSGASHGFAMAGRKQTMCVVFCFIFADYLSILRQGGIKRTRETEKTHIFCSRTLNSNVRSGHRCVMCFICSVYFEYEKKKKNEIPIDSLTCLKAYSMRDNKKDRQRERATRCKNVSTKAIEFLRRAW